MVVQIEAEEACCPNCGGSLPADGVCFHCEELERLELDAEREKAETQAQIVALVEHGMGECCPPPAPVVYAEPQAVPDLELCVGLAPRDRRSPGQLRATDSVNSDS